jgi:hypothetical protein
VKQVQVSLVPALSISSLHPRQSFQNFQRLAVSAQVVSVFNQHSKFPSFTKELL